MHIKIKYTINSSLTEVIPVDRETAVEMTAADCVTAVEMTAAEGVEDGYRGDGGRGLKLDSIISCYFGI